MASLFDIGDVVSINTVGFRSSFAIIRMILCHQKNNYCFAFVIVDWFEKTNRNKLGCPIYRLRTTNHRRKFFSISVANTVHFVHNCKDNECMGVIMILETICI